VRETVEDAAALDAALVSLVFDSVEELRAYRSELEESGLRSELEGAKAQFERTVSGTTARGNAYGFGQLGWEKCERLYALIRKRRPRALVETGVCNGVSTAVMLMALELNGRGQLHSVDLPEHTDTDYPSDAFWEGKKGAAVPKGKAPGWVVPGSLRTRWELTIGRSQDVLPGVLRRVGDIDFFLHDSEHSYECMSFELSAAHAHMHPGGVLAADDTRWNSAFAEFVQRHGLETGTLGAGLAFAIYTGSSFR
jgi:predicted O-methyltransferase YrrM